MTDAIKQVYGSFAFQQKSVLGDIGGRVRWTRVQIPLKPVTA